MAKRGLGPTVVAPAVIANELKSGELVLLDVDKVPAPLPFYVCWHDSPDSHTLRAVARLAQRIARRHSNQT
jgi:DNA-binding transcriptional LysR family regulator